MGLLTSIFGGGGDSNEMNALLEEEKKATELERKRVEDLKLKQAEERSALKTRSSTMRGGGREGLMFGGNQRGVA